MFPKPFDLPESALQFIWQHQYLNASELKTTVGDPVLVRFPGWLNADAGPDFLQARIRIGDLEWTGSVEIHLRASDFRRHGHHTDAAYANTVLHVVWEADADVQVLHQGVIPTLALAPSVDALLLGRFSGFSQSTEPLPCGPMLSRASEEAVRSMMAQSLAERLESRAAMVLGIFRETGHRWQETVWRVFARSMGLRVNADAMSELALRIPSGLLLKYRDRLHVLESLLFGVSGFLEEPGQDDYLCGLQDEFRVLGRAHRLRPMGVHEWKFSRMRPAGFPTFRLAQIASIVHHASSTFSGWVDPDCVADWHALLMVPVSSYWQCHTKPGVGSRSVNRLPGKDWLHMMVINAQVPLLVAAARIQGDSALRDRAVAMLQGLPPEQNRILRMWQDRGLHARQAGESQALIWHHREHCRLRRCLTCAIGHESLRQR